MKVGDQVVLLKGFGCSAHDLMVDGGLRVNPTGGEVATVEHLYSVERYPNGVTMQSVWIRFDGGGRMCTWTMYLAVYRTQEELAAAQEIFAPPDFFASTWRRIQLEA